MLEDLTAQMLFKGGKDGSLPLVVRAFRETAIAENGTTSSEQRVQDNGSEQDRNGGSEKRIGRESEAVRLKQVRCERCRNSGSEKEVNFKKVAMYQMF